MASNALACSTFRTALLNVPLMDRDAWLDVVFGLDALPDDGDDLPKGCVPYIPCPVDVLLHVAERVPVRASDVFVDVGAGVGRAGALIHLLTGAIVAGLEVQAALVRAARNLVERLQLKNVSYIHGDAVLQTSAIERGSVFLLYCPFSGDRLTRMLAALERVARARTIHICCVDLPLPPCPWLTIHDKIPSGSLVIYRSNAAA